MNTRSRGNLSSRRNTRKPCDACPPRRDPRYPSELPARPAVRHRVRFFRHGHPLPAAARLVRRPPRPSLQPPSLAALARALPLSLGFTEPRHRSLSLAADARHARPLTHSCARDATATAFTVPSSPRTTFGSAPPQPASAASGCGCRISPGARGIWNRRRSRVRVCERPPCGRVFRTPRSSLSSSVESSSDTTRSRLEPPATERAGGASSSQSSANSFLRGGVVVFRPP